MCGCLSGGLVPVVVVSTPGPPSTWYKVPINDAGMEKIIEHIHCEMFRPPVHLLVWHQAPRAHGMTCSQLSYRFRLFRHGLSWPSKCVRARAKSQPRAPYHFIKRIPQDRVRVENSCHVLLCRRQQNLLCLFLLFYPCPVEVLQHMTCSQATRHVTLSHVIG